MINEDFRKDNVLNSKNEPLSVGKSSINNYLNENLGHPRAIRKAFFLSKDQKKKRLKFCKSILEKNIDGKNIIFTDEAKRDMSPYTRDSIRLTKNNQKKLKKGELDVYNLINRE